MRINDFFLKRNDNIRHLLLRTSLEEWEGHPPNIIHASNKQILKWFMNDTALEYVSVGMSANVNANKANSNVEDE